MKRLRILVLLTLATAGLVLPGSSLGVGNVHEGHEGLPSRDNRSGRVAPTAEQQQIAESLGATVWWNQFGTPGSIVNHGGYLAEGLAGSSAVEAARSWLATNKTLFRLQSVDSLELANDARLVDSSGHAVLFKQTFDGTRAGEDGYVSVGVVGTPAAGWKVAYASSALTGDTALAAQPSLTPEAAWVRAAKDVGHPASIVGVRSIGTDREWTVLGVSGVSERQLVRGPVAVPTPKNGVRPAFETIFTDDFAGAQRGFTHFIDAATGAVLLRKNTVNFSHSPANLFEGAVPQVEGACDTPKGPWIVGSGEEVRAIVVMVEPALATNDGFVFLVRDGTRIAQVRTFGPDTINYAPQGGVKAGSYTVEVCDPDDPLNNTTWGSPNTYSGSIVFAPVSSALQPRWKVFPANPLPALQVGHPWDMPSTDIRKSWCWSAGAECDDVVQNSGSNVPWDMEARTNTPTFQTVGNNAVSTEAWTDPLAPGATAHRPIDPQRAYSFPWTNAWFTSSCNEGQFVPGVGNDINAAVSNLFAMHNRMHDWSYHLGFTEQNWNGQAYNFERGKAERDPVLGQAQAMAIGGQVNVPTVSAVGLGGPIGRNNANMRTLADGQPSITNMYLWQPLKGTFYSPCVDGDYDMAVIGHEYTHMIENRMIGKGGNRGGHHAGAMGESNADINAMEVLNEYGLVPLADENRYAVGVYATGNKTRGIRNYGMNASPLNFSNLGYDPYFAAGGSPVHADGEIWSAVNFQIREALVAKYNGQFPASDQNLQRLCADGKRTADTCPGNRRWAQLMYDAYLLMPTSPSMLQARDAYLAADRMRFAGANQAELWLQFARRGFGELASSSNAFVHNDTDPEPDFSSPLHNEATVTFSAVDSGTGQPINARVYVGQFEARTSPIADTNPATNGAAGKENLDNVAAFVPGTYEFLVNAPGYGHFRFSRTVKAGESLPLQLQLAPNWASSAKGGTAAGHGVSHASLIDDTEATNWGSTGVNVTGRTVTVDLSGTTAHAVLRVQVSALLLGTLANPSQNRFTALRQFEIWTCNATKGLNCATDAGYTRVFTSPENAFPGLAPRPTVPDMILRTFMIPTGVLATHVRLVVLNNQCTGQALFHGVQDTDPINPTDCRTGKEPTADPPGTLPARDTEVRAAEFQVMSRMSRVIVATP